MMGKIAADDFLKYFLFYFPDNRICRIMQIVSLGDNLHDMSIPIFWGKTQKSIINLSSSEFVHSVPSIN